MQKGIKQVIAGGTAALATLGLSVPSVMAADISANVEKPKWSFFDGDIGVLINNVLNICFGVGVIIALFFLIAGAFSWITSGGDKQKTADARGKLVSAMVGLILLAATWGLLTLILRILNISGGVSEAINDSFSIQQ